MYTFTHTHVGLHTYFASLGDKVTVIANGRARIFLLCRCSTYMFPCSPPSAEVQGRA